MQPKGNPFDKVCTFSMNLMALFSGSKLSQRMTIDHRNPGPMCRNSTFTVKLPFKAYETVNNPFTWLLSVCSV